MIDFLESTGNEGLAINTEKGKKYKDMEKICLDEIESKWKCKVIHTDIKSGAMLDGIITKDGNLTAIFEHRNREDGREKIREYGSIILSHHKFEAGMLASKLLRVPFIFIIHFIPDQKQYYIKITDNNGVLQVPIMMYAKKTRKNINDTANKFNRNNVFIEDEQLKEI